MHSNLPLPKDAADAALVNGDYVYYHYGCDGFQDSGWGCGYRVLQTICSWVDPGNPVPSIPEIISLWKKIEPDNNRNKLPKPWIGTYEGFLILDFVYDVPCRILHINSMKEYEENRQKFVDHFKNIGSPLFMGGESDHYGKCLLGVCDAKDEAYFLILDPHHTGKIIEPEDAQARGCVKWITARSFFEVSQYNFLMPLKKGKRSSSS